MKQLNNNIKAVLFDADGVIITGKPFSAYLESNYRIPKTELDTFFTGVFKKCLIGRNDLKEELPPHLKRWNIPQSVDSFLSTWFTTENKTNLQLLAYIQNLRQHRIVCHVATNQERYRVRFMEKTMKLNTYFDGIFASSTLGAIKPNPVFFQKILNKLPFLPGEIVFWDDNNDHVLSAKRLGINAHKYTNYEEFVKTMIGYNL